MEHPTTTHFKAAKRILRYIKGTINFGLYYSISDDYKLVGYSDSDWGGDVDDRKSTSGFVFFIGETAFTWMSKKQPIVTLSTCEAEYVAATSCVCHAIWLRNLLKELNLPQEEPTKIFVDNRSAIALAKNPVFHDRSKHIDTRYHYIRECVTKMDVQLEYVKTNDQVADIFTKPLKREDFIKMGSFSFQHTHLLNITGPFPEFLFRLPKLRYVTIRDNHLSGPLPVNIGSLSELVELDLEGNRLTGPIPSSISNLTRLTWLNLGGNGLSGTIPDVFKSMKELRLIDLSRNGLYGKLPPSMGSLAQTLTSLYLSQNNLSGTIPDYFSEFKALATFDLSRNRFTGVVPMSFAKLKSLFHLKLSHNLLTGPLPDLNPLNGIASLDLSYNKFHLKTIPQWVTSSPSMYDLKLVKCGIKMNIEEWEPVRTGLFYIVDLSKNDISGSPARFLNQAGVLQEFQASGNKLRFDLGKLNFTKSLRILDLSRNLVYGKVPASVAGLRKLSLSQNNLCGKLPVTKFPASVFAGNDCLCGSPLPPCKT
ncbi:LRR receptor-like serine/threonine-protein kinase GSO1 [Brassica napus]|uniref:LRR receptor-like serine/threonine-protein kinase GSO1 n=1 Tax=Brassica napus TaxID=3708 RepID=UPI0020798F1C|nr:LRR receptor-like serine/threonine-protein kinase GSO1 [Brassica napus]